MREILFKGKSISENFANKPIGEWCYGSLSIFNEEEYMIYFDDYPNGYWHIDIDPETVCQSTGLEDCNKNRIFEGDVLRRQGCSNIYIIFDDKTASLGWSFTDFIRSQGYIHQLTKYDMNCCEIIGNIHDNPEFLLDN